MKEIEERWETYAAWRVSSMGRNELEIAFTHAKADIAALKQEVERWTARVKTLEERAANARAFLR